MPAVVYAAGPSGHPHSSVDMSSMPQPSRRTAAGSHHAGPTSSDRAVVRRLAEAGRPAPRTSHVPTPFPASPVAVSQADGEA